MNGKIALGALGGIGLITTVSVASSRSGSSDPSWEKEMPSFSFLSADEAFMNNQQDYRTYRFGYIYSELLVGYADTNNDWWKWSYENLKEDNPLASTFQSENVSTTVPDSEDSLKNWCSEIYKADMSSKKPFDAPDSIFHNTSVWKYCSPIQTAPVSLEKSGVIYSARTVGTDLGKKLLAFNGNERIWHYRNKFFNGIKTDEFWEESNRSFFKEEKKKGRKIQDICADSYGKDVIGFPVDDTMLFCSISHLM